MADKIRKKLTLAGRYKVAGSPIYDKGDIISMEEWLKLPKEGQALFTDVVDKPVMPPPAVDPEKFKSKPTEKDDPEFIKQWLDARKVSYDPDADIKELMKIVKGVQG